MRLISEKKLRSIVRNYLREKNTINEDVEMTDELTKIVAKLGIGKDINKSVLAAAMKAGDGRNAKQNQVVADLFLAILEQPPATLMKVVPLLKKAAAESGEES